MAVDSNGSERERSKHVRMARFIALPRPSTRGPEARQAIPGKKRAMQPGALLMITSAFAFSAMTVLVKLAGERLPSQEIVFARALVSLVLSWSLLRRAGVSPWGRNRGLLWLRGALGFAGLSCVYAAITHLPLAEATVLQYLHPSITAILAGLFLGEALTRRLYVATGMSLLGVLLVSHPETLFGRSEASLDPRWVAVAVAGAAFSAAAYVLVRRLAREENPLVIVFYFPLVTVPLAAPTMGPVFVWPTGLEWPLLLGVGIATQIGQVSLTRGLAHLHAGHGTALSYLQVLFAAVWGFLVFDERPDHWTWIGGGLVLASAFWIARNQPSSGAPISAPAPGIRRDSSRLD